MKDAAEGHILVSPGGVAYYEFELPDRVGQADAHVRSGNGRASMADLSCDGEGMRWRARALFHLETVDGKKLLAVTTLSHSAIRATSAGAASRCRTFRRQRSILNADDGGARCRHEPKDLRPSYPRCDRSPICASAWRARAGPTSRRSSPGPPAPASPISSRCSTTGATASTGAPGKQSSTASAQFTVPIGGIDLHFIHEPGAQAEPDAAADLARLAGLGVRVPQADPAAHRALHRRGAVAARLHALVPAGAAALRRRRDRRHVRRADERARLSRASARRAATGAASSPRCWAIATPSA